MAHVNSLSVDLKRVRLSRWVWPYRINPLNLGPGIRDKVRNLKHQKIPLAIAGFRMNGPTWLQDEWWEDSPHQLTASKKKEGRHLSPTTAELNSANNENELGCEFFPTLQIRTQSEQYLDMLRTADPLWVNEWVLF